MSERANAPTVRGCAVCGGGTLIGLSLRVPESSATTASGGGIRAVTRYREVTVPWCSSEACERAMYADPAKYADGQR